MSTDRDLTPVVRSWLHEDAHEDAGRVLSVVLGELDTTPQRRLPWYAPRLPILNKSVVRFGLAALAVVLIALLGTRLLPTLNTGGPPTPSPTPSIQAGPTPIPPYLNGQVPLPPGRYRVTGSGLTTDVTVAVPPGWSAGGDWVVIGPFGNNAPHGMAIRFYVINNLAVNPVAAGEGSIALGPTVDDLATAVVSHSGWSATGPTNYTIDGHAGKLVAITIPLDVHLDPDGRFYLSLDPGGGGIWGWAAGQTFNWYIVDVGGQRLVVDSFHFPGTSLADLAAQRAVIDTIQFAAKP